MWRLGWPLFVEHPIFGNGWGTFQLRCLELQAQFLAKHPEWAGYWTNVRQVHNDPLQLLLEAGLFGLAAFGWVLWTYAREAGKAVAAGDSFPCGHKRFP